MSEHWASYTNDFPGSSDADGNESRKYTRYVNRSEAVRFEQNRDQHLKELEEVFKECIDADWDGEGAPSISIGAFTDAQNFIRRIPSDFSLPNILPEPDGTIGLEWSISEDDYIIINFVGTGYFNAVGRTSGRKEKNTEIPLSDGISYGNLRSRISRFSE